MDAEGKTVKVGREGRSTPKGITKVSLVKRPASIPGVRKCMGC